MTSSWCFASSTSRSTLHGSLMAAIQATAGLIGNKGDFGTSDYEMDEGFDQLNPSPPLRSSKDVVEEVMSLLRELEGDVKTKKEGGIFDMVPQKRWVENPCLQAQCGALGPRDYIHCIQNTHCNGKRWETLSQDYVVCLKHFLYQFWLYSSFNYEWYEIWEVKWKWIKSQ